MKLDVIVEIPKGSNIKYEYDIHTKRIKIDRILFGSETYPQNYGFIENTLDFDGDPLDVLIISNHSFFPGTTIPTRILGTMEMIDGGETDTKLIGVIDVDPRFKNYKTLNDIPKHLLSEIESFFKTYKLLQKKEVLIKGFKDQKFASAILKECQELFNNYKNTPKANFIKEMKKKYPNKYV